jgi:hypothetical protein
MSAHRLANRVAALERKVRPAGACPVCTPPPGTPVEVRMILTEPVERLGLPSPPAPEPEPPPPCPRCGRVPDAVIMITLDIPLPGAVNFDE